MAYLSMLRARVLCAVRGSRDGRCPRQQRGGGNAARRGAKIGHQRDALHRARPPGCRHVGPQVRRSGKAPERHQVHWTRETNPRQVGTCIIYNGNYHYLLLRNKAVHTNTKNRPTNHKMIKRTNTAFKIN